MTQTQRKPSILLVDDEPEILFSLQGLLRREFQLHVAESGKQALEILGSTPIDIIMTDQRMPGMTGIELMGEVRKRFPNSIRIVFTGYADIKAVIEAINSGGLFRYITKPWDPDDLLDVLRQAAQSHAAHLNRTDVLGDIQRLLGDIARNGAGEDAARAQGLLPRLNAVIQAENDLHA